MDDLIRSCKATLEAQKSVEGVCEMLDKGELKIRNWISNRPCVLSGVPDRVKDGFLQLDQSTENLLGMTWDPHADQIRFFQVLENVFWTKRRVLSHLARIFEPMGLLAAFLVRGKILMQELWKRDQPVCRLTEHSNSTVCLRRSWRRQHRNASVCERITTCNGSRCVHMKCQQNDEVKIFLLMSKTHASSTFKEKCLFLGWSSKLVS